jgi:inner membrane transporter RhtA
VGIAGVVVSATSVQVGAAYGSTIFPTVGPTGVVGMRQFVGAVVLLAVVRPKIRSISRRGLLIAVALGLVLVVMNLTFYASLERVHLGLAVTIEFLGPLGLSLVSSHRPRDLGCGLLALAGVVVVTGAGSATPDVLGVVLALLAAVGWAAYIRLNQLAGATLPGLTGTAIGSLVATIITLPLLVITLLGVPGPKLPHVLGIGALNGLLSTALPYSLDLLILRVVPRSLFAMLQSLQPVIAALVGFVVLSQHIDALQVVGILAVCVANVLIVAGSRSPEAPVVA